MILAWSGSVADIPIGWQLCDGTNGTPDLRGRFILGTSAAHPLGQRGGEEQHTLTINEMPTHTHTYQRYMLYTEQVPVDNINWDIMTSNYLESYETSPNGGNQPHNNMPPFYALAYIMRVL